MIAVLQEPGELTSLGEQWNELAAPFRTPLLQHEWFTACATAFCPPGQLRVCVLFEGNTALAIAPMMLVQHGKTSRLELLGSSDLMEPVGVLYRDAGSLRTLLQAVLRMEETVVLGRLPIESPVSRYIESFHNGIGMISLKHCSSAPWLPIRERWDEFELKISSSRRSSIRRSRKRLESMGRVQCEIVCPQPPEVDVLLKEFMAVEASGWKGKVGTAMLHNAGVSSFFSSYSCSRAGNDTLRLGFLRVGGKAIAVMIAVEHANRFWVLKVGYDEAWSRCSPGILLMHEAIRWAFQRKLDAFEFLGRDESWINIWTSEVHQYVTYRLYPLSIKGLHGLGRDVARAIKQRARSFHRKEAIAEEYPESVHPEVTGYNHMSFQRNP